MVSADDSHEQLRDTAPVLVTRLGQHGATPFQDPDPYTIAEKMLLQYSSGTTTFTQAELQRLIDCSGTSETLHKRLETLETIGFIIISTDGRRNTYTIKEPLELWFDDSPMTDLPVVASPNSVAPVPSATENSQSNQGVSVGPFTLPEPTPKRLIAYQNKWATGSALCFIVGLLFVSLGSRFLWWIAVAFFFVGLVCGSVTASMFTVRQLQGLRSKVLS